MSKLLAHRRQYVLGPIAVKVRPDWIAIRIANRLILSHCPTLRVRHLRSADGVDHYLLGVAVRADDATNSIADAFHLKSSADIENWTAFWAGNWLLISEHWCRQDASGSLGVLYRIVGGDVWISNSSALLGSHLPDVPPAARIPWTVTHNKGTDWIPAPFTGREGVFRVLPQRAVSPQDGTVRAMRFDERGQAAGGDCDALASALVAIMAQWQRSDFRRHWISLTAGLDTRTILAAAMATKMPARTFTIKYPITLGRDLALPPRIAAKAGLPFKFVEPPPVDEPEASARSDAISEHMDGATFHPMWAYEAGHDGWFMNDGGGIYTAGNCLELGRCSYWAKFANIGLAEAPPTADQLLDSFAFRSSWRPEPRSLWKEAMRTWIDSLADPVPLAADWRDRFYLDQRLASWHATLSQGSEIFDAVRFCPANCLWIFHLLLQFSPEERRQGFAQREVIRLLAPRLLQIPINPEPWSRRLKRLARRVVGTTLPHRLKRFAGYARPANMRPARDAANGL